MRVWFRFFKLDKHLMRHINGFLFLVALPIYLILGFFYGWTYFLLTAMIYLIIHFSIWVASYATDAGTRRAWSYTSIAIVIQTYYQHKNNMLTLDSFTSIKTYIIPVAVFIIAKIFLKKNIKLASGMLYGYWLLLLYFLIFIAEGSFLGKLVTTFSKFGAMFALEHVWFMIITGLIALPFPFHIPKHLPAARGNGPGVTYESDDSYDRYKPSAYYNASYGLKQKWDNNEIYSEADFNNRVEEELND